MLQIVLAINAVMFFVEAIGGYLAASSALQADSLDMFGDATVYASSLYVLGKDKIRTAFSNKHSSYRIGYTKRSSTNVSSIATNAYGCRRAYARAAFRP